MRLTTLRALGQNALCMIDTYAGQLIEHQPYIVHQLLPIPVSRPSIRVRISQTVAFKQRTPRAIYTTPPFGVIPPNSSHSVHMVAGCSMAVSLSSKHKWATYPRHSSGLGHILLNAGPVRVFSTPIASLPNLSPSPPTRMLFALPICTLAASPFHPSYPHLSRCILQSS